jgi:hypothetical protein
MEMFIIHYVHHKIALSVALPRALSRERRFICYSVGSLVAHSQEMSLLYLPLCQFLFR